MKLGADIDAITYDVAFWSQALTNSAYPVDALGDLTVELSKKFRVMAIALLLSSGDTKVFQDNLHRSGCVRNAYLGRIRAAALPDDHHAASARYSGLVDCIAARSWETAARIAGLSRSDHHVGHEYIDDFCFAQLLHLLLLSQNGAPRAKQLLAQWKAYLEGEPDPRLNVCAALHSGDAGQFADAFDTLIRTRNREVTEAVNDGAITEIDAHAEAQIYVEGIALLALAERRSIPVERDYLFCPAMARAARTLPFPAFP